MTHLLLLADHAVSCEPLRLVLERCGYTVSVARDPRAAWELLRDRQHDLLLLDVTPPELDGIGLCRRIRESSLVPILMMSARGDASDVVSGLEAGADAYVTTPVDNAVLLARIGSLLRRARLTAPHRGDSSADRERRSGRVNQRGSAPGG